MREYEAEPIRGLPELLPPGEELLWQGAPRWGALALRAFHARKVALYFLLLVIWRVADLMADGQSLGAAALAALWLVLLGAAAVGLLVLLAWLMARGTVYSITSQRLVLRFGIAIQMVMNLPFGKIGSVDLKPYQDGTGDICLSLTGKERVSYVVLWPHVRPWRFVLAQPMLRVVPDAARVAEVLGQALAAASLPASQSSPAQSMADGDGSPLATAAH